MPASTDEPALTCTLQSLDLRATTPALLAWVRAMGLDLVSMQAQPVTLTDIFSALTRPRSARPKAAPPEGTGYGAVGSR